jgi:sortase (surface protein transpeptidase)
LATWSGGTGLRAASAQRALAGELNQQWQRPGGRGDAFGARAEQFDVATGRPFAFIRIPAFGRQWRFTLIQGTALAQLNVSPGHVPGTQWPGQLGNFAIAGHRVTAGNPFWSLPGRTPVRAGMLALIILAVAAALWFYVFPWASLHLPIDTSGFSG